MMRKRFLILLCLCVLAGTTESKDKWGSKPHAKIDKGKIQELSGMIRAARTGEYWGLGDSGNHAEITRFNLQGMVLQKTTLLGISNVDWESITRDNQKNLYIGDTGDNDQNRSSYVLYRIVEPSAAVSNTRKVIRYPFSYADGKSHNCEALFFLNGTFYLISKEKNKENSPLIFRLPELKANQSVQAQTIGAMQIEGRVSDAAYSSALKRLLVLTDRAIFSFRVEKEADLLLPSEESVKINWGNCEGTCFDGESFVVSNEKGEIWRYAVNSLQKALPSAK